MSNHTTAAGRAHLARLADILTRPLPPGPYPYYQRRFNTNTQALASIAHISHNRASRYIGAAYRRQNTRAWKAQHEPHA